MDNKDKDTAFEVRLAYMQRDIDILKIQMSELKAFAEKASQLFHTMSLVQNQLDGFDTRLDEKLELFSLKLESKLNKELKETLRSSHEELNRVTPAPEPPPQRKITDVLSKEIVVVILYVIVIIAGMLNIKLPAP